MGQRFLRSLRRVRGLRTVTRVYLGREPLAQDKTSALDS